MTKLKQKRDLLDVRIQTRDKTGTYFNISNQVWPPGASSNPSSYYLLRVLLAGYPDLSNSGGWATLPYTIQPFGCLVSLRLWASWLLHLVPLLPLYPYTTPARPSSVWSCPLWTFPDGPVSGYALPFIHNKPPPTHLGAVVSFFFHSGFTLVGVYHLSTQKVDAGRPEVPGWLPLHQR